MIIKKNPLAILMLAFLSFNAFTQENTELLSNDQIAKKLANPMGNIISLPLQFNFDYGQGPDDNGQRYYLQIQPVIPVNLTEKWMMVSRSILLLEGRNDMGFPDTFGLGDLTQNFWFGMVPAKKGLIWGIGPVFYLPTATSEYLGEGAFALGPSGLLAYQFKYFTVAFLVNQMWSVYSWRDSEINQLFLQPAVVWHLPAAVTITVNSETAVPWEMPENTTLPINLMAAKVFRVGQLPVNVSLGGRYYIMSPDPSGPDWGLRLMVTLVLPGF